MSTSTPLAAAAPLDPPGWTFLVERGILPADLARFRRVFAAVWPRFADDVLAEYVSRVELTWTGPREWSGIPTVFAGFNDGRRMLAFAWDRCRQLPDDALAVGIGHELAHATFYALGRPDVAQDETAIDELLVGAGFDPSVLDAAAGWPPGQRLASLRLAAPGNPWQTIAR